MTIIYALAALGAYRVVRRIAIIGYTVWKERHWSNTTWLMPKPGGSTKA